MTHEELRALDPEEYDAAEKLEAMIKRMEWGVHEMDDFHKQFLHDKRLCREFLAYLQAMLDDPGQKDPEEDP